LLIDVFRELGRPVSAEPAQRWLRTRIDATPWSQKNNAGHENRAQHRHRVRIDASINSIDSA
jgi:hypothetical protein